MFAGQEHFTVIELALDQEILFSSCPRCPAVDGIEAYARAATGDTAPADSTPPTHLAGVLVGAERGQP